MTPAALTVHDLAGVELLATCDVAIRLALSPSRVAQLAREGRIPAARMACGQRVFLAADIDAFQRARLTARAEA